MKSNSCYPSRNRKILLLSIAILLCFAIRVQATVITVCPSGCGYTTIAAAMTAAVSGDTIKLNVTGFHTEKNITVPEKNLVLVGLGKNVTTLQSAATRADAVNGGRIFTRPIPTGVGGNYFIVEDLTIRHAYAPLVSNQANGGVLLATGSLKGMITRFNRVKMFANETAPGNSNNSGGACIYISSTGSTSPYNALVEVNDCDFDDNKVGNSASGSFSLSDGACFNLLGGGSKLNINNSTFTNNSGYTRGGVMYVGASWTVNVSNSMFGSNTCRNGDGGCFSGRSGTWTFDNCLFKNNSAVFVSAVNGNSGYGGVFMGTAGKFSNCTFFNNTAVMGGALLRTNNGNSDMQLINCTFYGNNASSKGKSIYFGSPPPSTTTTVYPFTMVNTIITNGGGTAANEIHFNHSYNDFTTNRKNYCNSIGNDEATPGTTPTFEFTSSNTPTLGLSSTLSTSNGAMESLSLSASSPMVNAGSNVGDIGYSISTKDQRNYSRYDLGIDVGAFEYNGIADNSDVPVISYTALGNTLAFANRTLQATITDANGVYWFNNKVPRIYYRNVTSGGSWASTAGVISSGDATSGTWNFTIDNSLMGGLALNDQVEYYIIASDVSTAAKISSNPAGATATDVNTVSSPPPSPRSYLIAAVLPVTLLSFTAETKENDVLLKWKVTDVVNFSHFEIERSREAQDFIKVGEQVPLNVHGDRQYSFTDKNVFLNAGTQAVNYRLKMTDIDNTFSYSQVIQVIPVKGNQQFVINTRPNPFTESIKINLHVEKAGAVTFRLLDISGHLVRKTMQMVPEGSSTQALTNLTALKPGVYILEIVHGAAITREKVIKR